MNWQVFTNFNVAGHPFEGLSLLLLVGAFILLWISWGVKDGALFGGIAFACRVLWLLPFFLCFIPETKSLELPRNLDLKPVHILVDDSQSMKAAWSIADDVKSQGHQLGISPRVTKLSTIAGSAGFKLTPLKPALKAWLEGLSDEPWILVSDGGDTTPHIPWASSLQGVGRSRGLILQVGHESKGNLSLTNARVAPVNFEGRPTTVSAEVRRESKIGKGRVQVQLRSAKGIEATETVEFQDGDDTLSFELKAPPRERGVEMLEVVVLPSSEETMLWDNSLDVVTETVPDTLGILHLLGSPSWDGRFFRRYLKGEPKYDLISFFILRDPWDSQQVNEREMSLIPFPVERLFREELKHFRVVVIQNFALTQFLSPEYQERLVQFVKDGGGLLFIGGPRALQGQDLASSPLGEILPFTLPSEARSTGLAFDKNEDQGGYVFEKDRSFKIQFANPSADDRALANVYDEWEGLSPILSEWSEAKGLHHLNGVQLKPGESTLLLQAKLGSALAPLALASYPGKGRALWLLTDSFWRLANTPDDGISRQIYNQFMQSSMTWLTRQDLRPPLSVKSLVFEHSTQVGGEEGEIAWTLNLEGPTSRYVDLDGGWDLSVCGQKLGGAGVHAVRATSKMVSLRGKVSRTTQPGEICQIELSGVNRAFGSVKVKAYGRIPRSLTDEEVGASPKQLSDLAKLTEAKLITPDSDQTEALLEFFKQVSGRQEGIAHPPRFRTVKDYYWVFGKPWALILLIFLPVEVMVRRRKVLL